MATATASDLGDAPPAAQLPTATSSSHHHVAPPPLRYNELVAAGAFPIARGALQQRLFDLVLRAAEYKYLKCGLNVVSSTLQKNETCFVVLAADAEPVEIVLQIPMLCEARRVPYGFVESKLALGRAARIERAAVAVCFTLEASPYYHVANNRGRGDGGGDGSHAGTKGHRTEAAAEQQGGGGGKRPPPIVASLSWGHRHQLQLAIQELERLK